MPNLLFPLRGRENEYLKDTLMDGELVLDIDQHKVRFFSYCMINYLFFIRKPGGTLYLI